MQCVSFDNQAHSCCGAKYGVRNYEGCGVVCVDFCTFRVVSAAVSRSAPASGDEKQPPQKQRHSFTVKETPGDPEGRNMNWNKLGMNSRVHVEDNELLGESRAFTTQPPPDVAKNF